MPRTKPYRGTSHERLSQLLRGSQTPQLPSNVTFDYSNLLAGANGTTAVDVTALIGSRRDDSVSVSYQRLSVDALKRLPAGEIIPFDPILFPTNMHAILPQINQALGLDLVAEEVSDVPLPRIPLNGITVTITEASLAWLAGDYFFPYAPNADQPAARGVGSAIPTDERRRIRLLERPISVAE